MKKVWEVPSVENLDIRETALGQDKTPYVDATYVDNNGMKWFSFSGPASEVPTNGN